MRDKKSDIEVIREYYQDTRDRVKLNERQAEIKDHIQKAWSMLSAGKPNQNIVKVLFKDFGLTKATAYRRIKEAIELYGDIRKASKEGMRFILYDLQMKTYDRAKKADDIRGQNAAIANLIKISGVDKENVDLPNFEQLEPNVYPILIPEQMQRAIEMLLQQGSKIDLSKLMTPEIEDAIYEDISDTEPDSKVD